MTRCHLPTLSLGPSDAELDAALDELRFVALRHPVAAASGWRALVAEGRRFGATPEGRAWRQRIVASPLLDRLRLVVEKSTGDWLSDEGRWLPSDLAEAVVLAAGHPHVEGLLERSAWRDGTVDDDDDR